MSVHVTAPARTRDLRADLSLGLLPARGAIEPTSPALVVSDGAGESTLIDHGTLRDRVDTAAAALPPASGGRLLVEVPLRPQVDDVVGYLAVLEAGHVALVTAADITATVGKASDRPGQTWHPDLVMDGARGIAAQDAHAAEHGPRHELHPDLALLLSTSGSTGSPKLVRLGREGVLANARAIAAALALTPADRGVTSLPLHYCFGLSVLHSHLVSGGSLTLTDLSVTEPNFWELVDRSGVTTLPVVPHQLDLLASTGELDRPHPSLRRITQAGGRLAPERVRAVATQGAGHGWGLSVMYGQTEATARICVHDPADVTAAPDAVGRPVPGTTLHLDTDVREARGDVGEVIVRGPGVMLGYAVTPADLALGRSVAELRTGDLGRIDGDGVLRVVGRRSGFVKILGLRIDLGRVERALEAEHLTACVTGDDDELRVAVEPQDGIPPADLAARARRLAAQASGVGVGHVRAAVLPLPRLANDKVDRAGADALVRGSDPDGCTDARRQVDRPSLQVRAAAVLADVLDRDEVELDRSFVELGGDSLSHVLASTRLTALLGELPRDWHRRPVAELVTAATPPVAQSARPVEEGGSAPAPRLGRPVRLETSVVLRAIAVVIICGSHADLFRILGGAHTLLVVAGFNAARFGLAAPTVPERWRGTGRLLVGVAVPTMVVALFGLSYGRYGWDNVFLANWLVGDIAYGKHNELWFVDALVACLVLTAAVLSLPPVARRWQVDPWRVSFALVLVALVPRFLVLTFADGVLRGMMPTVLWLFAVGMALAHADTPARRRWTLGAMALGIAWFFPDDPIRNLTIFAGVAVLALVPTIRVPARLVPVVTVLAAASLHIYLIQFQILGWVPTPLLATLAALAAGVLLWRLADRPVRRLQDLVDRRHTPSERNPA